MAALVHRGRSPDAVTIAVTVHSRNATTPVPRDPRCSEIEGDGSCDDRLDRETETRRHGVATVFSVMRNVSVPIGIKVEGQPNIADTLWLTVSDQKNKVYYYQDTKSPGIIWTKLSELDFSEGSGPRKLQLDGNLDTAADQTKNFKPAELFKFLAPHD